MYKFFTLSIELPTKDLEVQVVRVNQVYSSQARAPNQGSRGAGRTTKPSS